MRTIPLSEIWCDDATSIKNVDSLDLLLGVLVYLEEMGIKGIPLDALHELFYQAKEAGHLIVKWKFTKNCGKSYSQTLDRAENILCDIELAYRDYRRGRKLRGRAIARANFFERVEVNNISSEFLKQIKGIAEFIAASKMI
jgi:hypothetical protein